MQRPYEGGGADATCGGPTRGGADATCGGPTRGGAESEGTMSLIAGNLGVVQRTLDASGMRWAICAGAAAHLYGNRRPIQDVDLLVANGMLPEVVRLLSVQQKVVQFDGQRILWRGIKVFDDLTIRKGGQQHPFLLDDLAFGRLQRMPLLGAPVQVLAPEDIVIHKIVLGRGAEQGKHDLMDAAGIVRRRQLDADYVQQRIVAMRAGPEVAAKIAELERAQAGPG